MVIDKNTSANDVLEYFNKFPVESDTDDITLKHDYRLNKYLHKLASTNRLSSNDKPTYMLKFIINDLFRDDNSVISNKTPWKSLTGTPPDWTGNSAFEANQTLDMLGEDEAYDPKYIQKRTYIPYSYSSTKERGVKNEERPVYRENKEGTKFFESIKELPDDLKTWVDWRKWLQQQYNTAVLGEVEEPVNTEDRLVNALKGWDKNRKGHAIEPRSPEYDKAHQRLLAYFTEPEALAEDDPLGYNIIDNIYTEEYDNFMNKAKSERIKAVEALDKAKLEYIDKLAGLEPEDTRAIKNLKSAYFAKQRHLAEDLNWLTVLIDDNIGTAEQRARANSMVDSVLRNRVVQKLRQIYDIKPSPYSAGDYINDWFEKQALNGQKGTMLATDARRKQAREQYKVAQDYLKQNKKEEKNEA